MVLEAVAVLLRAATPPLMAFVMAVTFASSAVPEVTLNVAARLVWFVAMLVLFVLMVLTLEPMLALRDDMLTSRLLTWAVSMPMLLW